MNNIYKAFIVTGDRESGSYACYGQTFTEAALNFGNHWNECGLPKYGTNWTETGKKEGYPDKHMFLQDNRGNKILLFGTTEKTTFQSK